LYYRYLRCALTLAKQVGLLFLIGVSLRVCLSVCMYVRMYVSVHKKAEQAAHGPSGSSGLKLPNNAYFFRRSILEIALVD